jgi:hypothetical protein
MNQLIVEYGILYGTPNAIRSSEHQRSNNTDVQLDQVADASKHQLCNARSTLVDPELDRSATPDASGYFGTHLWLSSEIG